MLSAGDRSMTSNMDPHRAYVPAHVGQDGRHMPVVGQNAGGVFARMFRCTSLQSTGRVRVAALPAFFTSFYSVTMTVMDTLRGVSPALLSVPFACVVSLRRLSIRRAGRYLPLSQSAALIQTAGHTVENGGRTSRAYASPTPFPQKFKG